MEIRYVNPRFLPAFILLMPPHSMLIVMNVCEPVADQEIESDDATKRRRRDAFLPYFFLSLFLFLPFSRLVFHLSSSESSCLCHVHVVRSRRVTVIWSYYLPSFYIGEPIVSRGKALYIKDRFSTV